MVRCKHFILTQEILVKNRIMQGKVFTFSDEISLSGLSQEEKSYATNLAYV